MNLKIGDKFRLLSNEECVSLGLQPLYFSEDVIYTILNFDYKGKEVLATIVNQNGIKHYLFEYELPYVVLLTPKTNYGRKKYELVFRRS